MTLKPEDRDAIKAQFQAMPGHHQHPVAALRAMINVAWHILYKSDAEPREPDAWEKSHLIEAVAALRMRRLPRAHAELGRALRSPAERGSERPVGAPHFAAVEAYDTDRLRADLDRLTRQSFERR
jgi:hypothetical protein